MYTSAIAQPKKAEPGQPTPPPGGIQKAAVDFLVAFTRIAASIALVGGYIFLLKSGKAVPAGWLGIALGVLGVGLFAWKRKGKDLFSALAGVGAGVASLVMGTSTPAGIVAYAGAALAFIILNLWILDLIPRGEKQS